MVRNRTDNRRVIPSRIIKRGVLMPSSYDDLYETFLLNTDFDVEDLPQTDEMRHIFIQKAVLQYNRYAKKYSGRLQGGLVADDIMEQFNLTLTNDELLILSYLMAEMVAVRIYTSFSSLYATYAKEMGISNYSASANAKKALIDLYKEKYISIIEDQIDSFVL